MKANLWKILAAVVLTAAMLAPVLWVGVPPAHTAGTTYIDIAADTLVVGGGTAIKKARVLLIGLGPTASSAAVQTRAVNFSISGIHGTNLNARVAVIGAPAPTSLCPLVGARITATDQLTLDFAVLTAAVCTGATGTYEFLVIES